ncbi:hypothetical protein SBRY_50474 [Actinacidiphila bryophytorum]|uniref:Uncharacterized protein n=1 Tax=Actinacidiphila bryophytorum TaxID=1436133 RepID=A0A9W4H4E5_9ACTN|nr:hypothetical protein SBRY_50474 [Actinacidiphila bryophytorum]
MAALPAGRPCAWAELIGARETARPAHHNRRVATDRNHPRGAGNCATSPHRGAGRHRPEGALRSGAGPPAASEARWGHPQAKPWGRAERAVPRAPGGHPLPKGSRTPTAASRGRRPRARAG